MTDQSHLLGRTGMEDGFWTRAGRTLCPVWLRATTPSTVKSDVIAGLTSATVVLPQAVAFAAIAGLPPQYGFYTAIVVPIIAGLWGSSWVMVSGPTLVISALVASTLLPHAQPLSEEYIAQAIFLTFFVGMLQCLFGALRLGRFVNFISHSVMVGFTAAAAVLIAVSQIKDAFGIVAKRGHSVFEQVANLVAGAGSANLAAAGIAAATLLTLIVIRILAPKLPAFIIALAVGAGVGIYMEAGSLGVRMVGVLPSIAPLPALPTVSLEYFSRLSEGAFAIALLGLVEAISIGRAFGLKQNRPFDANREIVAQGVSNVVGGVFQCYPASGSFTRSGVNYEAGAATPLSAILSSAFLVAILLVVAPLFGQVPIPAVAAVILYVAYRLVDIAAIRHIVSTSRSEAIITGVTFVAGLFVNLEFAVYGGVIVSLLIFLSRSAKPTLSVSAPDGGKPHRPFRNAVVYELAECPQTAFVRLDGALYFGSVDYLERELERLAWERPRQRKLVLILRGVGDIDMPGAELIIAEARRRRARGGDLYLVARFRPLLKTLERFHVLDVLGPDNVFETKEEAISRITATLDREICSTCPSRIFRECPRATPDQPASGVVAPLQG
ncbi:SulP family inorganic anion transporter [Chelatococcus sambhunathii]|uniref:SulP family inorganic anion transporter n=1 Tax=Chelatococcus sambhunathii TaxID=363953 RepID=A0ABU1DGH7_9HYPH|nr:SulP family inorganic anion transporter [Chelatococcus sambhunathii]MDR4307226.1 SulP family inorganic anion transporter [Chelatococcus sambhunathii]